MTGLGTVINVVAIVLAGILGKFCGGLLSERYQDTLNKACGVCVLFIGIAGTMEGMLSVEGSSIVSGSSMLITVCLAGGSLLGEWLNLEDKFESFGEWLKQKSGNASERTFVDGFVTASLTVSIGAMAIVGAIEDGIFNDYSILVTKSILDFLIILVMTCSMGKGCAFSAIPVGIFQGSVTVLANLVKPLMTDAALSNISLMGSIMVFCVGLNLVWGKRIRVANLLPGLIIALIVAFLPFNI